MTSFAQKPDVIVIGAGAAGLSAAAALRTAGVDAVVLEAAAYVGGRCVTDCTTFSVPFDRGGSWMHDASINPLARLAEQSGAELHKTPWVWSHVQAKGHRLSDDQLADYRQYQDALWEAINATDGTLPDVANRSVLPEGPWVESAKHVIGQMMGGDADVTSAQDVCNYADGEGDWLITGGLGAFIGRLHQHVPVRCKCSVSKIDTTGPRVRVTTPQGTLEAQYVIVTVSTGVLARETIEFVPPLPAQKRAAIDMVPNGLLNKVGIEFDPAWTEAVEGDMADYHSGDDDFCNILFGFYGSALTTGFVAGSFADRLETEGPGAATAFCLEALRSMFGNDIGKSILRTTETAWRGDPNTVGAYSFARPGAADSRKVLAAPIDESLHFAGEATMTHAYATVHGAYLSGKRAAQDVLSLTRRTHGIAAR